MCRGGGRGSGGVPFISFKKHDSCIWTWGLPHCPRSHTPPPPTPKQNVGGLPFARRGGERGLPAPLTRATPPSGNDSSQPSERSGRAPGCLFGGKTHPLFLPTPFSRPLKRLPSPRPPSCVPFLRCPRFSCSSRAAFPFLSAPLPPCSVWVCRQSRGQGTGAPSFPLPSRGTATTKNQNQQKKELKDTFILVISKWIKSVWCDGESK